MAIQLNIQFLPVLIATIVSFIFGWIWYGPLFGKTWMKLNKVTNTDIKKAKQKGMTGQLILNFIGNLVTAWVVALFINGIGASNFAQGFLIVFWAWLGFIVATTLLGSVLWDNKPWGLFVLNGTYWLINLIIMSAIIVFM